MAKQSTSATRTNALEKARKARARVDAEEADRQRRTDESVADFFIADDEASSIRQALQEKEAEKGAALAKLRDLGATTTRIADLCSITAREVRELLRLVDGEQPPAPQTPDYAEAGDDSGEADAT